MAKTKIETTITLIKETIDTPSVDSLKQSADQDNPQLPPEEISLNKTQLPNLIIKQS